MLPGAPGGLPRQRRDDGGVRASGPAPRTHRRDDQSRAGAVAATAVAAGHRRRERHFVRTLPAPRSPLGLVRGQTPLVLVGADDGRAEAPQQPPAHKHDHAEWEEGDHPVAPRGDRRRLDEQDRKKRADASAGDRQGDEKARDIVARAVDAHAAGQERTKDVWLLLGHRGGGLEREGGDCGGSWEEFVLFRSRRRVGAGVVARTMNEFGPMAKERNKREKETEETSVRVWLKVTGGWTGRTEGNGYLQRVTTGSGRNSVKPPAATTVLWRCLATAHRPTRPARFPSSRVTSPFPPRLRLCSNTAQKEQPRRRLFTPRPPQHAPTAITTTPSVEMSTPHATPAPTAPSTRSPPDSPIVQSITTPPAPMRQQLIGELIARAAVCRDVLRMVSLQGGDDFRLAGLDETKRRLRAHRVALDHVNDELAEIMALVAKLVKDRDAEKALELEEMGKLAAERLSEGGESGDLEE